VSHGQSAISGQCWARQGWRVVSWNHSRAARDGREKDHLAMLSRFDYQARRSSATSPTAGAQAHAGAQGPSPPSPALCTCDECDECDESTRPRRPGHTYWFMSLVVLTVTGVPRREPWRPYGRIVSPERELQLLSADPWRPMDSGFRVIVTGRRCSTRCACKWRGWRVEGGGCSGRCEVGGCLRRRA